jgi:hypothetical protein
MVISPGWPSAINVTTRLGRFGKGDADFAKVVNQLYEELCDAH